MPKATAYPLKGCAEMLFKPGDLAIDMGSVNCLVSAHGSEEIFRVPSQVVRYVADPSNVVAVGDDALAFVGRHPDYLEIKRPVREGRIIDEQAFIELMKYLVKLVHPNYSRLTSFTKPSVLVAMPVTTKTELKAV